MQNSKLVEVVRPYPGLELLSDSKGFYGLAIEDQTYFVRSDIVRKHGFGTLESPSFSLVCKNHHFCGDEYSLFTRLFENKLKHQGLTYPAECDWWSDDPKKKRKNRQIYFGLRQGAFRITNTLLSQVLTTIPEHWIKTVRRYPLRIRPPLYRDFCKYGDRFVQAANTFPILAIGAAQRAGNSNRIGIDMFLAGDELKVISKALNIPMAYRKIKPAIVRYTNPHDPDIPSPLLIGLMNAYLPSTSQGQRLWFTVVSIVKDYPTEIIRWFAKHAFRMGPTKLEAESLATDLADYVRASTRAQITDNDVRHLALVMGRKTTFSMNDGENFITRPFNSEMSLNTVMRLSNEWHEAVAAGMDSSTNIQYPEPWFPQDNEGNFEFIPITEYVELFREGKKMRHCVATYSANITAGDTYVYSLRNKGKRMYTVELVIKNGRISLGQVRGKCNTIPNKDVMKVVRKWCSKNNRKYGPNVVEIILKEDSIFDFEDGIPF